MLLKDKTGINQKKESRSSLKSCFKKNPFESEEQVPKSKKSVKLLFVYAKIKQFHQKTKYFLL